MKKNRRQSKRKVNL